jgi:hypothetical protein
MNDCPVCKPYANKGYQELFDGRVVPCYACNRAEFEAEALGVKCPLTRRWL